MKYLFRYWLILLVGLGYFHLPKTALATEETSTNMIAEFQHSFKAATPKAKRDLVIAAIDSGLIKRGLTLTEAKAIFGQDLQVFPVESQKSRINAVVFFEPVQPPPTPMMSALRQGWYVDMAFSSNGKLEHYSLSNLHN